MGKAAKIAVLCTLGVVVGIAALQSLGQNLEQEFAAESGQSVIVAPVPETPQPTEVVSVVTTPVLPDHIVEACKASIALMNSRDPGTFTGKKIDESTAHVAWRNPDDNKRWQARCETIDGNRMRWAAFNAFGDGKQGRWRDEDAIIVSVKDSQMTVQLDLSGAIQKQESYSLSTLS